MDNIFTSQAKEIQKHRWIESKKAGRDVGEEWAAADWVSRYAFLYRLSWNKSIKLTRNPMLLVV